VEKAIKKVVTEAVVPKADVTKADVPKAVVTKADVTKAVDEKAITKNPKLHSQLRSFERAKP
jgi:hypothetical protein